MYYSIPGIRTATMFGKDVDPSDKEALCRRNHSSASAASDTSPNASAASSDSGKANTKVLRQTRISFEAPMDLKDLMFDHESSSEGDYDEFDILDELLKEKL